MFIWLRLPIPNGRDFYFSCNSSKTTGIISLDKKDKQKFKFTKRDIVKNSFEMVI